MEYKKNNPLDVAIDFFRSDLHRDVDGRRILFHIPDGTDFEKYYIAAEEANLLSGRVSSERREIEILLPSNFFFDLKEYLGHPSRRIEALSKFFIVEFDKVFALDGEITVNAVKQYMDAVSLFEILREIADHEIKSGGDVKLVFLGKEKLVITSDYNDKDLCVLEELNDFREEFIESPIHLEQKHSILKLIINEMFLAQKAVSLAQVLARFSEFVERVKNSYRLYISEFSFEKVRAKVEKQETEFTSRLNKVFSDIQNQILAIPVALILAGGQMKNTGKFEISNFLIWCGALIFGILTWMLIRNQKSTLKAVKNEYEEQKRKINDQHRDISVKFGEIYKTLEERFIGIKCMLVFIQFLISISFLGTSILLWWYSSSSS